MNFDASLLVIAALKWGHITHSVPACRQTESLWQQTKKQIE